MRVHTQPARDIISALRRSSNSSPSPLAFPTIRVVYSILPEEGIKNLVLASESSVRPDLLSDVIDASVAHENYDRTS